MTEWKLGDDLRREEGALARRHIHHTRPREPMTADQARDLSERMAAIGKENSPHE